MLFEKLEYFENQAG